MNLTICNFKGGVGKSLIAHQLITGHGFYGIELDPYGSLAKRLPSQVLHLSLKERSLPAKTNHKDIVFDFGGFDDIKLEQAIEISNLVIVPFIPTLESVHGTLLTLKKLQYNKPILLVANMGQKQNDIKDAIIAFEEDLGQKLDYFILPLSIALQTAVNENKSVHDLAKCGGIKEFAYKKASEIIKNLYCKIQYFNE